ncbi:MAG: DUF86 domain-containing protein [Campylobacterales bacterium]|nr:DUF86 domain-containing protein [Campylobacterales bacterium]
MIGEASRHLLKENLLDKEYQIVVDFRNHIIHQYFGVDHDVVWQIVHTDLIHLERVILILIKGIEQELKKELIEAFIEDNRYLDFVVEKLERLP